MLCSLTSPSLAPSLHLHHHLPCLPVVDLLVCTTVSTSPSRSTTLTIHSSQGQCTSKLRGSVASLVCAVKEFQGRLTTSWMKPSTSAKVQTQSSVCCTTSLQHHGLGDVELCLHADNCTGQNKNNAVLQVCFQANPPHTHRYTQAHTRTHSHTHTHTHTRQHKHICRHTHTQTHQRE